MGINMFPSIPMMKVAGTSLHKVRPLKTTTYFKQSMKLARVKYLQKWLQEFVVFLIA